MDRPPDDDSSQTPRPNRFEDFDLPDPAAIERARVATGRTPIVTTAAGVLFANGLLGMATSLLIKPGGAVGVFLLVVGFAQLLTSALVFVLHPVGRWLGIVLGMVGVGVGVVTATESPANGLVSMALNGFVIYALASSGPSFRRG